jgi:hypothetical protein
MKKIKPSLRNFETKFFLFNLGAKTTLDVFAAPQNAPITIKFIRKPIDIQP